MEYTKIEKCFTDYIIDLIGPNEELDKSREMKFQNIKKLILKALENESDMVPYVYCFGSYPLKIYLQDSDLDITIMFEDKIKNTLTTNCSFDFLNR